MHGLTLRAARTVAFLQFSGLLLASHEEVRNSKVRLELASEAAAAATAAVTTAAATAAAATTATLTPIPIVISSGSDIIVFNSGTVPVISQLTYA